MKQWASLAAKPAAAWPAAGLVVPAARSALLDSLALCAIAVGACLIVLSRRWRGTARPLRPGRLCRGAALDLEPRHWPTAVAGRARSVLSDGGTTARTGLTSTLTRMPGSAPRLRRRAADLEPAAGGFRPDASFWGPDARQDSGQGARRDAAQSAGYRSRHRVSGAAQAPRRADGRRAIPRHAAPSLSQRMTGRRDAA